MKAAGGGCAHLHLCCVGIFGVASASVCRREKDECEWRSDTAAAQSRLKLHCRWGGGLWGQEGDKAAAREFLGQGALHWERNHQWRKPKQQESMRGALENRRAAEGCQSQ